MQYIHMYFYIDVNFFNALFKLYEFLSKYTNNCLNINIYVLEYLYLFLCALKLLENAILY